MWQDYYSVVSTDEAIQILAEQKTQARIIAGATDLMLEMERGVRKGINTLIDVTRINGLDQIRLDEENLIHVGPLVTHGECASSKLLIEQAFPLAKSCWEIGAPQIRNRGTVAGNLITASPANDTIPALIGLNARVVLQSIHGQREVPLTEFYKGVRVNVMRPEEMMVDIKFPALDKNQRGTFYKLGLRKAQAISLVNCVVVLTFDGTKIIDVAIVLGSVAPVIIHAKDAEEFLLGKNLDDEIYSKSSRIGQNFCPTD